MAGSIAPNLHEGSRSEILADYLFSTWGTVTPVRRQDDYGIDLFCTLTKRVGQRAFVSDHYSVQVKSNSDPWVFEGIDSITWLADHPTPLYLACVDKGGAQLSIYRTAARFIAAFWPHDRLVLTPGQGDEGERPQWRDPANFDMSAPILRVGLGDLTSAGRLAELGKVFEFWVGVDRDQCTMRRMGLLRVREPDRYRVNEIPINAGTVEQGMTLPTPEQLRAGVATLVEALDCVGHQALVHGDRTFALYAALLLHHIRTTRDELKDHPVWGRPDSRWGMERHIVEVLDTALLGRPGKWGFESLTLAIEQVKATPAFAKLNAAAEQSAQP